MSLNLKAVYEGLSVRERAQLCVLWYRSGQRTDRSVFQGLTDDDRDDLTALLGRVHELNALVNWYGRLLLANLRRMQSDWLVAHIVELWADQGDDLHALLEDFGEDVRVRIAAATRLTPVWPEGDAEGAGLARVAVRLREGLPAGLLASEAELDALAEVANRLAREVGAPCVLQGENEELLTDCTSRLAELNGYADQKQRPAPEVLAAAVRRVERFLVEASR